ncbi:MAG: signal peptidase II [Clostridiales bacterium]|nr:signal peptidase II [Clostridiales bacterium]
MKKRKIVTALVMLVLIGLDQLFKYLAVIYLKPVSSVTLIKNILRLYYVQNTGAAFGLFKNNTVVLTVFTALVIVLCLYFIFVKPFDKQFYNITLCMIVSGGAGNLIDRIFRLYVIDYIEATFIDFPVFNFADILVTCSSFLLAFYLIYDTFKEKKAVKSGVKDNE